MEPATFDIWTAALERMADPEAAEVAVVELAGFERRRPSIAHVVDAYRAVRIRWDAEAVQIVDRPALEPSDLPPNTPAEIRALIGDLRAAGVRGPAMVRELLTAKGVEPPRDAMHADAYDPPLSLAEQRHFVHAEIGSARFCDVCRFCRGAA